MVWHSQQLRLLLLFLFADYFRNVNTHQSNSQQQTPGHQLSPKTVSSKRI